MLKKIICISNADVSFKFDSSSDINVLQFNYLNNPNIDEKRIVNQSIKTQKYEGFWLDVKRAIDIEFCL